MDRDNTEAKITNYFSKTTAKIEKSLDYVAETSDTPAASEPSSVDKNRASSSLEENKTEQPIENIPHKEMKSANRFLINQTRKYNFSFTTFWKTKTCF